MIKHLAVELPKLEELSQPPILPKDEEEDLKILAFAVGYFIKNYEEAVQFACENTFKLSERLAPFLIYKNEKSLQDFTANALYKICKHDEHNKGFLNEYIKQAGTIKHPQQGTSIATELQRFTKLAQMLEQ